MENQTPKVQLEQQQQQSTYPEPVNDCEVKIYLNGYLIKTVYAIDDDPAAFLKRVKADDKGHITETEISIILTKGNQKKEIEIRGLMRQVLITAWQDNL